MSFTPPGERGRHQSSQGTLNVDRGETSKGAVVAVGAKRTVVKRNRGERGSLKGEKKAPSRIKSVNNSLEKKGSKV